MSYIALYRKWRPMVFDEIIGQESIIKVLKSQVENQRIAHAYLFSGSRGTGKTSSAKVLARAVNCENPIEGNPCNACETCKGIISGNIMDVVEIDAASNNSVDDVRLIREEVFYSPSVCKYRVYIIDEVHMLSIGAFNALLKILEEPPKHVVFILATTEPHKLPATILSRCQRFEFRQIGISDIKERLKKIVKESNSDIDENALEIIAKASDGALRDAISILDQCMNGSIKISDEMVKDVIGVPKEKVLNDLCVAIADNNFLDCINIIDEIAKNGRDLSQFISVLIRFFRDLLVYKVTNSEDTVYLTAGDTKELSELSALFSQERITLIIKSLSELEVSLKWSSMPRVMIEVEMLRICSNNFGNMDNLIEERISIIEDKLSNRAVSILGEAKKTTAPDAEAKPQEKKEKAVKNEPVGEAPKVSGDLFDKWSEVINQLKVSGKMVLYANLIGTKAKSIDENTIGILFEKSASDFGKTVILKNENQELLKSILKKVTGSDYTIKCLTEDKEVKVEKKDKKEEKVEEIAKKFNLPINIVEE